MIYYLCALFFLFVGIKYFFSSFVKITRTKGIEGVSEGVAGAFISYSSLAFIIEKAVMFPGIVVNVKLFPFIFLFLVTALLLNVYSLVLFNKNPRYQKERKIRIKLEEKMVLDTLQEMNYAISDLKKEIVFQAVASEISNKYKVSWGKAYSKLLDTMHKDDINKAKK